MDTTLVSNAKIITFPLYTHFISKKPMMRFGIPSVLYLRREKIKMQQNKYGDICFVR